MSDRYGEAESHRSRKRNDDRRSRDADTNGPPPSGENNNSNEDDEDEYGRKKKYEKERAQRMARLRQEMREEDEELAAMDQKAKEPPKPKPQETIIEVKPEELEGLEEEEQMKKLLGFDGFGSTKGDAVEDNQNSAARGVAQKNKARKYRQYMNRKNGFNRPLDNMD